MSNIADDIFDFVNRAPKPTPFERMKGAVVGSIIGAFISFFVVMAAIGTANFACAIYEALK